MNKLSLNVLVIDKHGVELSAGGNCPIELILKMYRTAIYLLVFFFRCFSFLFFVVAVETASFKTIFVVTKD